MTRSRLGTCMLIAVLLSSVIPTTGHADAGDDYVACLIGRAAVVLHKQAKKDSGKALEVVYKQCKQPKGLPRTSWKASATTFRCR
ncbi:hypothetical protein LZK73_15225 [Neorhizobium galegae]|nr:hypothetical protein LZK73_15225 [Neorhizobium galegae]